MNNDRLAQLIYMYVYITGESTQEASAAILRTETGKAIQESNPEILYEQQSANLDAIVMELQALGFDNLQIEKFSPTTIHQALEALYEYEKRQDASVLSSKIQVPASVQQKNSYKENLWNKNKNTLLAKKHDSESVGRLRHVVETHRR